MGGKRRIGALISVAFLAAVAGACGGGASAGSNSTPSKKVQSEPSLEFLGKGPNGQLVKVGREASQAEREAASRVLKKSFDAREAHDWRKQCSTLSSLLVEQIEKASAVFGATVGCAVSLELQTSRAPKAGLENNMTGPIDILRVNQRINGFAFYHGTRGKDYIIPLIKEHGEWRLTALAAEEIPH